MRRANGGFLGQWDGTRVLVLSRAGCAPEQRHPKEPWHAFAVKPEPSFAQRESPGT